MKNYLIDTNTCIYYIKGKFELKKKFENADPDNCFISEITLAELMFGAENSEKKKEPKSAGLVFDGSKDCSDFSFA